MRKANPQEYTGDLEGFQEHMRGFLKDFLVYLENSIEVDDAWNTYDVEFSNTGSSRWTWCGCFASTPSNPACVSSSLSELAHPPGE
jgi:hypothetical protein